MERISTELGVDPMSACNHKLLDAYRHGAERVRELCIAIAQPVGNYSNTPEMQERLKVRCEITDMIHSINIDRELELEAARLSQTGEAP